MAVNVKPQVEAAQKTLDLEGKDYIAELKTSKGPIRLKFFPDVAPGHVKNFLGLAKSGFYNGLIFHRVIDRFMIQAGCPEGTGRGGPGYTIKAEFNATPHEPGTLSMARTNDPHSAGSQFFLCLERTPHLDRQYTAFGKVADEESLRTVQAIGKTPTKGDRPTENIKIESVTVTEKPRQQG